HIGAYTISLDEKPITFLDTPGHEAFTSMRRRGAMVTDIAIIVVAADDGIMPQTVEAINHAKEAKVEIIVAVNKIDKPGANIDKIKNQLPNYDLVPDDWGGDVYVCPVSAKSGEGVRDLLETVLLVADAMDLKANKEGTAQGSIIEARLDKGLGPVATVLVQSGTLKVGDFVVAGTGTGRIRAMTDYTGKRVKEAVPSFAVQVQGFTSVPNAGDNLVAVKDAAFGKQVAEERAAKEKAEQANKVTGLRTLEEMFKNAGEGDVKKLSIIIKGDVQGSVEAVKQSFIKLSDEMSAQNVVIRIIHSAAGAISESDIMLADTAKALVIGFNVKAEPKAKALADRNGVEIRTYSIIYDAIDDVTNILNGMTEPIYEEDIIGHAEIREVFKITGVGNIAGCYVTDGKLARGCKLRLIRDNIIIYNGVLNSLKREKDDAKEVARGYEC
ncbi:MAG: translation initiation factor IF-2, partial [Clostridia bacterium]|nr:translation initiation factor IF-2 [Clostridia bacterium]